MALEWKEVEGKQVCIIDGATNPAFILDGQVLEVRITGAEHLSGEKSGTEAEIKAYCDDLLAEYNIPLEGTQTEGSTEGSTGGSTVIPLPERNEEPIVDGGGGSVAKQL